MPKLTRRSKKYKKNMTVKFGGAYDGKGVIDILKEKAYGTAQAIGETALDTGLKIVGLERISKKENYKTDENINTDDNIHKISDTISGVGNTIDRTGATVIENVNEVLDSNIVQESTTQAAKNTAEILKKSAGKFNEAINNPEVKKEVIEAIDNASEILTTGVKAMKEPISNVVEDTAETLHKTSPKFTKAAVNAFNAGMEEVPIVGTVYAWLNIINNVSKAISAATEAGTEVIESTSDAIIETKKQFDEGIKELEEKKKLGSQISNRTTQSINQFENPIPQYSQTQTQFGGKKTRKRLFKRRVKSKRVRFAI